MQKMHNCPVTFDIAKPAPRSLPLYAKTVARGPRNPGRGARPVPIAPGGAIEKYNGPGPGAGAIIVTLVAAATG